MENKIEKVEPVSPLANAAQLCQTNEGMDVGKLKELLELQERWDATQAKKAYMVAMAEFKKDPPEILKDQTVKYKDVKYNHASLCNVTTCINKALSEHGLTASWLTSQDNGAVKVTCKIAHILGHSEETGLSAPPDASGSKNPIQAIASTVSYLERYTLLALTGLATHDQDDDGIAAGAKKVDIVPPTEAEQDILTDIAVYLIDSTPEGKVVDESKIGPLLYGRWHAYPQDPKTGAKKAAKWIVDDKKLEQLLKDAPKIERIKK